MNTKPKRGIKEQIASSNSATEIKELLAQVKSFKLAHPKTIRKCERAASQRLAQLKPQPNNQSKREYEK